MLPSFDYCFTLENSWSYEETSWNDKIIPAIYLSNGIGWAYGGFNLCMCADEVE
jgi:hypothetical protein